MQSGVQPKPKSRRFRWGGLAAAVILGVAGPLGVLAYQGDQPMQTKLVMPARAAFSINIPTGCQMTEDPPGPDFQVFRIICGGVEYAGVYTGNAADRTMPRSRLTETEFAWPFQVQTWSRKISGDQEKADRISASVSVKAMN